MRKLNRKLNSIEQYFTDEGWISTYDKYPELDSEGESEYVLCVGWKGTHPEDTVEYVVMKYLYIEDTGMLNWKGEKIKHGWSIRSWDTNPDLYDIYFWKKLKYFTK